MMKAGTCATVNLSALNLIEFVAAAYHSHDSDQANRHQFRAEEAMKKIADALGFDVVRREPAADATFGAQQAAE